MGGPSLLGLVGAELTGGTRQADGPQADRRARRCPTAAPALTVDEATKQRAVEKLPEGLVEQRGGDLLAVPARVAARVGVRLGALEEEVQVVLPGEADAAVDLQRRAGRRRRAGVGRVGLRAVGGEPARPRDRGRAPRPPSSATARAPSTSRSICAQACETAW